MNRYVYTEHLLRIYDADYPVVTSITRDGKQYVWNQTDSEGHTLMNGRGDRGEMADMLGLNEADLRVVDATLT